MTSVGEIDPEPTLAWLDEHPGQWAEYPAVAEVAASLARLVEPWRATLELVAVADAAQRRLAAAVATRSRSVRAAYADAVATARVAYGPIGQLDLVLTPLATLRVAGLCQSGPASPDWHTSRAASWSAQPRAPSAAPATGYCGSCRLT